MMYHLKITTILFYFYLDDKFRSIGHHQVVFAKFKQGRVFISVINQFDEQNFCFTISLFHASTCFEHMCCVMQFWPPDDEHMCSKHVEAWNKLTVKQKFCASSWLITEINILRCTVSKPSKKKKSSCGSNSIHGTWDNIQFTNCMKILPQYKVTRFYSVIYQHFV